jgi:hypothetical protein
MLPEEIPRGQTVSKLSTRRLHSRFSLDSPVAAIPDRVRDTVTPHACKRNERMNPGTFHAQDVVNLNPAYSQRIGDERTVTTPWNRFRTHNRAPLLPGQFDQSV